MTNNSLVAADVTRSLGGVPVLRDVSFKVEAGGTLVLRGPSGSGKTTLLRILCGLEVADGGWVEFNGVSLIRERRRRRRPGDILIGYAPQAADLWDFLPANMNVALPLVVRGLERRRAIAQAVDLLTQLGLGGRGDQYPAELSGGERQRVALARALSISPDLLILDEPTASLDAHAADVAWSMVNNAADRGAVVVVATHAQVVPHEHRELLLEGRTPALPPKERMH